MITLTVKWEPLIVTVTPAGIGTGAFPIRDSLHSVTGVTDRKFCGRGCCCLNAPTRPLKLLCMQCICVIAFETGDHAFTASMQRCSGHQVMCLRDCPICLQGFCGTLMRGLCSISQMRSLWSQSTVVRCLKPAPSGIMAMGVPMADTDYIKRMVGDTLAKGCAATVAANPTDPVEYLGQWLLQ